MEYYGNYPETIPFNCNMRDWRVIAPLPHLSSISNGAYWYNR